jgi:predicted nucleic acid-binding protein
MLIYLDVNCFHRPFNDQRQDRIRRETAAVIGVLRRITDGVDDLVWSSALTLELSAHPEPEIKAELESWTQHCRRNMTPNANIRQRGEALAQLGLKPLDAAHIAFSEAAGCSAFLTCDDRLLRAARRLGVSVRVLNPVQYFEEVSDAGTVE